MQTPPELIRRLERVEAAAGLDLARRSHGVGAVTETIAGAAVVAATIVDLAFLNRCVGLASQGPVTAGDVDAISAWFRAHGRRQSMVQLPAEVTTPDLEAWLDGAGYRRGRNWVQLWHALDRVADAPTSLRIERIGVEHAGTFGAIVMSAMGMPPETQPLATGAVGAPGWHHYLGFDGSTPVSAAAMFVEGDSAWLGFGTTLETARGRGGQSALFARRLRDARELGCTIAVTETGEETAENPVNHSYRNMLRSGFTLAYARPNWVRIDA